MSMPTESSLMNRTLKPLLLGLAAAGLPLTAATAANIEIGEGNAALDIPAAVTLTTTPGELYINGVSAGNMVEARVDPATGHIWIKGDLSVDGGSGGPGGGEEPDPPVNPEPDPPVNPGTGSCDKWAALGSRPLASSPGSADRYGFYSLGNEVKSFEFTARQGVRSYTAAYSTTGPATKTVWVSHCPGGEPVDARLLSDGYQTATVRYGGGAQESGPYIKAGETYYFNVVNAQKNTPATNTCRSNCTFKPNHY